MDDTFGRDLTRSVAMIGSRILHYPAPGGVPSFMASTPPQSGQARADLVVSLVVDERRCRKPGCAEAWSG